MRLARSRTSAVARASPPFGRSKRPPLSPCRCLWTITSQHDTRTWHGHPRSTFRNYTIYGRRFNLPLAVGRRSFLEVVSRWRIVRLSSILLPTLPTIPTRIKDLSGLISNGNHQPRLRKWCSCTRALSIFIRLDVTCPLQLSVCV